MTRRKLLLTLSLLCATLSLGGCERESADADDVKREARELADTLKSYSTEQKEQAVEEARRAVDELNEEVARLKERLSERWSEMDESARQRAEKHIEELDEEQAQLDDRLDALRSASGDAWARLSEGFAEAYAELREAWQETDQAVRD